MKLKWLKEKSPVANRTGKYNQTEKKKKKKKKNNF